MRHLLSHSWTKLVLRTWFLFDLIGLTDLRALLHHRSHSRCPRSWRVCLLSTEISYVRRCLLSGRVSPQYTALIVFNNETRSIFKKGCLVCLFFLEEKTMRGCSVRRRSAAAAAAPRWRYHCVSKAATPRAPSPPHSFLFLLSPYCSEPRPLSARNAELIVADAEVTSAAGEIKTPGERRNEGVASNGFSLIYCQKFKGIVIVWIMYTQPRFDLSYYDKMESLHPGSWSGNWGGHFVTKEASRIEIGHQQSIKYSFN